MGYSFANRWRVRITFVILIFAILFVQTLPLQNETLSLISPDVILAFTYAWAVRRPDAVTPVLVVLVTLLMDFLLHRPPGLWTIFVLLGTAFLQSRTDDLRESLYSAEWILVTIVMAATFLIYQGALIVTFSGALPWNLLILQAASTIMIYPLVTITSRRVFGIHKPSLTDPQGT